MCFWWQETKFVRRGLKDECGPLAPWDWLGFLLLLVSCFSFRCVSCLYVIRKFDALTLVLALSSPFFISLSLVHFASTNELRYRKHTAAEELCVMGSHWPPKEEEE
jgi:hypothetical protein